MTTFPKPKKKSKRTKHSVSDSTLMALWRKAVLVKWGYRDPIARYCDPSGSSLECHHVIKRRYYVLRWDVNNGIPLTIENHRQAERSRAMQNKIWELVDGDYLEKMEHWLQPEWLRHLGLSDNEWRLRVKAELLRVIGVEA